MSSDSRYYIVPILTSHYLFAGVQTPKPTQYSEVSDAGRAALELAVRSTNVSTRVDDTYYIRYHYAVVLASSADEATSRVRGSERADDLIHNNRFVGVIYI